MIISINEQLSAKASSSVLKRIYIGFLGLFLLLFLFALPVFSETTVEDVSSESTVEVISPKITVEDLQNSIKNFGVVNDSIYRGAQPPESTFPLMKDFGIRVVVNLRDDKRSVEKEKLWAEGAGLEYISIPMSGFKDPGNETIQEFIDIISSDRGPFFVHCKYGQERTGVTIACYRIARDGWTADQAYEEMKKYNFRTFWFRHLKNYVYNFAKKTKQCKKR